MAVAPLVSSRWEVELVALVCMPLCVQACSRKGLFSIGPLQCGFQFPCWRLLLLSAAGKVVSVRISSSTSVRATLCCSSHLNDSFLLTPLVLSEFGSLLQQVHDERQMGPFPFFSSIPLHSPAIQLFPISSFFCVFCHTSASILNPHLNSTVTCPGFPCSSF